MPLFGRRRPPAKVTASAARTTVKNAAAMRRLVQPWQETALGYYDDLGCIKFGGNFLARGLAKLRIFPAYLDENGEPQETEDADVRELLDRVQDPNGGRTNLFGTYGRLRFLTGESYLVCTFDDDLPSGERWEMLSTDELRVNGSGGYTRMMAPQLGSQELKAIPDDAFEPLPDTAIVYRLWRPHPRFSMWADSSMRGVLADCEELLLLQAGVRARIRSRLAGPGMLVMSDEISPPTPDPNSDEDMMIDPFYEDLIEATTASISDPGTASAAVPMLVRVNKELVKDGFNFISFRDSNEEYREVTLRDEALKRISIGLDMPPEVLLGLAEVNHWSAWAVDEQTFKSHIEPVCQELVDDLTSAYLRPAARDANVAKWDRLVVGYDAAALINHPDRAKDAKELYGLRAISKATLRDACNFDDEDAMPEDERAEAIGIATRDSSLAWFGIPSVRSGGIEPVPGEIENAAGSSSDPAGPTTGAEVEAGPPPSGPPDPAVASAAQHRILGAADIVLQRARELAGNRIQTKTRNLARSAGEASISPDEVRRRELAKACERKMRRVPQQVVASAIGVESCGILELPDDRELVRGAGQTFVETMTRWGYDSDIAELIAERIEIHAAATLFEQDPPPLPAGFASYVSRLTTAPELVAA